MLYIPMYKARRCEISTMKKANNYFSDKIIPLIEILQDHYGKTEYDIDPATGEAIKEKHKSREVRKRKAPTSDDIDTLSFYSECVGNKKAFIDYFRYSTKVYGRNIDTTRTTLSIQLNQNEKLYTSRLEALSKYSNLIPVLSIKKDYYFQNYKLEDFIKHLQHGNNEIAVRLDESSFGDFAKRLASVIRETDYLMYDIGEQKASSKTFELTEFENLVTRGKKIVINSPRKRATLNGAYENKKFTSLIDNSARDLGRTYQTIIGFGDYCGLKDTLPTKGGSRSGCALALLYLYDKNQYMTYVNPNKEDGEQGFHKLIPQITADSPLLDTSKTCPVMKEIVQMGKDGTCGGWSGWIRLTCMRYLHQMHANI